MIGARETAEKVRNGELTAARAVDEAFTRIDALEPQIGAFTQLFREEAAARARAIDARRKNGERLGLLAGVPVAVKDNICTAFGRTTCSSRMLADYRSPYDATVIERLHAADAVIVGKTNLDEFAMGSSTENSAFGRTRNPWSPDCVPGGSSGGSAAAVAARMVPLALGSDTGGSIRQPAAFCGIVGLKPTYGAVSRYGLVAFASSLDQIGPLATNAGDAALLLQTIAGHDPRDATALKCAVSDYAAEPGDMKKITLGLPREFFAHGIEPAVRENVMAAVEKFRALGARIVEIDLPHACYAIAAYYLVATAEASSNLARYDGVHYGYRAREFGDLIEMYSRSRAGGFGPEVKRRIMLGTYALSSGYYDAYYLKAAKVRTLIGRDFRAAFAQVDAIVGPTAPETAFLFGDRTDDPLKMYLSDVFTVGVNLAGVPALSLSCGFAGGKPVGLQLIGNYLAEAKLLALAAAYQNVTDWHRALPEIVGGRV